MKFNEDVLCFGECELLLVIACVKDIGSIPTCRAQKCMPRVGLDTAIVDLYFKCCL